jgi:lambda family phage holin
MGLTDEQITTAALGAFDMPDKPDTWAVLTAWLHPHWSAIFAACLSGVIAALRVIYDGGKPRESILESLLCGTLTLAVSSTMEWLSLPPSMATFFGGIIGLAGVKSVRRLAVRRVDRL